MAFSSELDDGSSSELSSSSMGPVVPDWLLRSLTGEAAVDGTFESNEFVVTRVGV